MNFVSFVVKKRRPANGYRHPASTNETLRPEVKKKEGEIVALRRFCDNGRAGGKERSDEVPHGGSGMGRRGEREKERM